MIIKTGYRPEGYEYTFQNGFRLITDSRYKGEYRILPEKALLDVYLNSPTDWISPFGFIGHVTVSPEIYRYEPAKEYRDLSFIGECYYPPTGWDCAIPDSIEEPFILSGYSMEQRLALLQEHVEFALVDLGWEATDELVLALWGYKAQNTSESSN